jgi:predicted ATP-grasp superfamily ATP-dependent carboligase
MESNPVRPLRALVLGVNEHPRAVATVRSLGRAGIPVIGVKADSFAHECRSRYLQRTYRVNPTDEELLPFLESFGRNGGGVVVAVHDKYLVLASKHAESLSRHFTLTMPRWEILSRIMDRTRLYEIARRQNLGTPTCFKPRAEADLERIVADLDFSHRDYALRTIPGVGIGPADPVTGRSTKAAGKDAATVQANCLEIHSRLGEFPLIAEIVPGERNECVGVTMVVDRSHAPILAFCTHRLKLPLFPGEGFDRLPELGSNVYCESVHDEEAIDAAARLVGAAEYTGLITVEFRRDPGNGNLVLIRADPRVVRPTSLSTALGMDTPSALYRLSVNGKAEAPRSYAEGVGWLWETLLLETLWNNREARPIRRELLALRRHRRQIKAFAYFSVGDPLPFLVHAQWRLRAWAWARIRGAMRRCAMALGGKRAGASKSGA